MHILLPDFAFQGESHPSGCLTNHLKKLTLQRARTVEARRSECISHTTFHDIQKSLYLKRKEDRQISTPITERQIQTQRSHLFDPNISENSTHFHTSEGQPIHSRKTTRFVNTLHPRRRSSSKNSQEKPKKILDPNFNFLKTTKYSHSFAQVFDPEIVAEQVKKKRKQLQPKLFTSKFPTKKVKSAFLIEEYRPWSPKKGELTVDQFTY